MVLRCLQIMVLKCLQSMVLRCLQIMVLNCLLIMVIKYLQMMVLKCLLAVAVLTVYSLLRAKQSHMPIPWPNSCCQYLKFLSAVVFVKTAMISI